MPVLNTSLCAPDFDVTTAGPTIAKLSSEYLSNVQWVEEFKLVIKGVNVSLIDKAMMGRANALTLALEQRLDLHVKL